MCSFSFLRCTNDIGDIAIEGALGGAYGTISGLANKGIVGGIEKIFPATSPLFGGTMNTAGNIVKNVIAGAGGAYAGTATTGEARNIYNALRGREVTKEDWVKPVWSAETGVTTLIGGISGGLSGTMADKQVRTKYIKDVNDLQGKLKIYAEKFNNSIQNGDEQSALDIARVSRDELVKFSMNDYGGRTVDKTAMNDLATKWKTYLENSVKYNNYMRSNAYANSNIQPQLSNPELNNIFAQYNGTTAQNNNVQTQPNVAQETPRQNVLQGATSNAEQTIANNVPNALKNAQNQPNIVQNSQNNVQNALDFEKTGQNIPTGQTLQPSIENTTENGYNQVGGVEDGRNGYKNTNDDRENQLAQIIEREKNKSVKIDTMQLNAKRITNNPMIQEYEKTYNKKAYIFDGSQSSFIDSAGNAFFNKEQIKDYGFEQIERHENVEDMLNNYTEKVIKDFTPLISKIMDNQKGMTELFNLYKVGLTSAQQRQLISNPIKVAKEILCDINAGKNGTSTKLAKIVTNTIKNNLEPQLYNDIIEMFNKYENQIYGKENSTQGSFLLPTSLEELQRFDNEQNKKAYDSLHMKNKSENSGMKERSFVKNANTTSWIPEEFKGITGEYTPISNAETLAKAHERINNEDYQSVKDSFLANDLRDATDTAIGELLMQKAINDKNYKDYDTITCALAEKLTRAGQAIQAASILKRLTPDGMIMYAQKQLKNARIAIEKENKKLYEELKEKSELPELNEEDTKFIYEKMEKANELDTSNYWGKENREKEILIGQALTRIANKIPSTALDIVAGIRRNGLLFNLKTLKRNVGSNIAFSLQEAIKDILATVADEITSFFTGKRTTKLPNISAYWKGMKKGSVEAVEDVKYGISTAGGGSKYELPSKVFKRTDTWNDILQKYKSGEVKEGTEATFKRLLSDYEDTAMFIVEGTDRPFWQGRFESELANQMKLNGLEYGKDIPTEEMLETAKESADYATFKNENKVSRFLGNTRNLLNNGKAIGAADALGLTFTNVPGSVASKAYDYSPFGLTKVLTEIKNLATKNGKFNQRKFVDAIGRVITGTGLGALVHMMMIKMLQI